jgi:heptosyltransferase I
MVEIPARRIGLVRLSAIGDTVHALALANGIRRGYPDARLTWIVEPISWELLQHQPAIDRFIVFNPREGLAGWRKLAHELRGEPFDLLLVPQVSAKATMVSRLARAKTRLGFDRERSRELHSLFVDRRLEASPPAHAVDQNLEFLDHLGIPRRSPEWNLVVTDEEKEEARAFYNQFGRPAVALVVSSSRPEKDWTAEGYAAVAERVDRQLDLQPVLVGGPGERDRAMAEAILRASRNRPSVALDRPLRSTLAKLWGASVVVAPDTGPLHIAVALGRPTVGLYGFTDPRRTGPYGFRDLLIDRYNDPGEEDAPITRRTRPGRMETITADQVFDKIRLALERYPDQR